MVTTHLLQEAHLLKESLAVPAWIMIAVVGGIASARSRRHGGALEQRRAREESGRALVCYVQLHRHCSEEAAYQRLAAFVETRVPFDDQGSLDRRLASERQSLLKRAQGLLVDDPNAIDEI